MAGLFILIFVDHLDANGIPIKVAHVWRTTPVTEVHTENHFDLTPLLTAYQDYDTNFDVRSGPQCNAYWVKIVGSLQLLLPVHILQRYCDPDTPFYPLKTSSFKGVFKRTTEFYNDGGYESFFYSCLSTHFSLSRGDGRHARASYQSWDETHVVLAAVSQIDKVSTKKIAKIKQLLAAPGESPSQFPFCF